MVRLVNILFMVIVVEVLAWIIDDELLLVLALIYRLIFYQRHNFSSVFELVSQYLVHINTLSMDKICTLLLLH